MWCCCIQRSQHFRCATLVWLYSTVCFQMCFQMSPQTGCTRRCIFTLVAFVWLFSIVFLSHCSLFISNAALVHLISLLCLFYRGFYSAIILSQGIVVQILIHHCRCISVEWLFWKLSIFWDFLHLFEQIESESEYSIHYKHYKSAFTTH